AALGGAAAQPLVVALLRQMSWRQAFPIFGSLGVLWAVAWWRWFRDDPAEHGGVNATELATILAGRREMPHHEPVPWGLVVRNRTLFALCVAPAWAVCLEIGGPHAGVVSGAMNTFGNLGGTLSPTVVGLSLGRWNSWSAPLASVALFYLVAAVAWLAIDPAKRVEVGG